MIKRNKIITVATITTMSLITATQCLALVIGGHDTTRGNVGTRTHTIAKEHSRLANANAKMHKSERSAIRNTLNAPGTKRKANHNALDNARAAKVSKIINARAENAKTRIKKLPTTTQYSQDQRDEDANKIDNIKTEFIIKQSN